MYPHGLGAKGGNQDISQKDAPYQDTAGRRCAWYACQNVYYRRHLANYYQVEHLIEVIEAEHLLAARNMIVIRL